MFIVRWILGRIILVLNFVFAPKSASVRLQSKTRLMNKLNRYPYTNMQPALLRKSAPCDASSKFKYCLGGCQAR